MTQNVATRTQSFGLAHEQIAGLAITINNQATANSSLTCAVTTLQ